ncbi:MAG: hypothetical protein ACOCP8_00385 [archaeon]
MKRLIRKNNAEVREFIIPTTPTYNPMGEGDPNSEFKKTDDKSYQKMFNKNTIEEIEKREEK